MSTQISKLRKHIRRLVTERITADRGMTIELEDMDKSVKSLDKNYRALINNSFSRVILDDGQGGKLFDVQLYPTVDITAEGYGKYDMRAYFHDSDRVFKKGLSCEDICEYIKGDMKKCLEEDGSYVNKALVKGKRPSWEDSDYEYAPVTLAEAKKKDSKKKKKDDDKPSDEMEEVKKYKRQEDFEGKDLEKVAVEEMLPGIDLSEFAEKIENAVWGAIKREVESTHKKTAKADHDHKNLNTKEKGHTITKAKRQSSKTDKMKDKPKKHETAHASKGKDSKVNTAKVKDFKKDERKAKSDGKDETYTPSKKKSK